VVSRALVDRMDISRCISALANNCMQSDWMISYCAAHGKGQYVPNYGCDTCRILTKRTIGLVRARPPAPAAARAAARAGTPRLRWGVARSRGRACCDLASATARIWLAALSCCSQHWLSFSWTVLTVCGAPRWALARLRAACVCMRSDLCAAVVRQVKRRLRQPCFFLQNAGPFMKHLRPARDGYPAILHAYKTTKRTLWRWHVHTGRFGRG
jgi:hypothetical protein